MNVIYIIIIFNMTIATNHMITFFSLQVLAASSVILPLFSSISLAIAFVLGTPLAFERAKFRSLLAVAVYPTDYLTASLTA